MIELAQVACQRGGLDVLKDLSLSVAQGELVALLGESGSGKTTTLKLMNRLVERSAGVVRVDGHDVRDVDPVTLRRGIGYAFQGVGLFPHLTVAQNLAVVPRLLGWKAVDIDARVIELLAWLELDPVVRDRAPSTLSGGQAQRVGLARALAARPKVMLLDEPFGAVDPLTRDSLQRAYVKVHRAQGLTTVMVTHDVSEALLMADRLVVLAGGKLVASGAPAELMSAPQVPQVERLLEVPRRQAAAVQRRVDGRA